MVNSSQSSCTILYSHQNQWKFESLHNLSNICIVNIYRCVCMCVLCVVSSYCILLYMNLMTWDVEYFYMFNRLFIYLLFWAVCSSPMPIWKIRFFVFYYWLTGFLCILWTQYTVRYMYVNMSSQSLTCLFIFLRVSFNEQEFYSLMYTVYLCFSFMVHTFYVCLENFLPIAKVAKIVSCFFP